MLLNATLPDGTRRDVELADGIVASVEAPNSSRRAGQDVLDLDGYVLFPAPADPHAHLDKALSWDAIRPATGDLRAAVTSWRAYESGIDESEIAGRALQAAVIMLSSGTTAVRTHTDILAEGDPLRGVRALLQVKRRMRSVMDLQVTLFISDVIPDELVAEAIALGADLIGGGPHLASDPSADLHRLVGLAERHGVGIDLHTDENTDGVLTLGQYAEATHGWVERGRTVTAGHCVRLASVAGGERAASLAAARAAGMGIVTLPLTNLYLQGRDEAVNPRREIPPLREILQAGVTLAAGGDNVRDPFNPVGRGDALETVSYLVTAGHLSVDEALDAVTTGARKAMGLAPAGTDVGAQADLLAIRGGSSAEAIAAAPTDRYVIHRGNLVAETHTTSAVGIAS